jgi:ribosomal protein S6--L-glutamate ligase
MKLAILSRSPNSYSTRRLCEAAEGRGHEVEVLDVLQFAISLEEGCPDLFYQGEPVGHHDAAIPRVGASVTFFGTAVVRQLEQMEVFCANSALGITSSRDKLRSLQILSRHPDIGIPATEFVRRREDVMPAIERVGGAPVIIKLLEGTQGVGVILAETARAAEAIVETLQSARQNVLIQKFVAESKGKDVRAIVVGDRVVAAMRRVAQGGDEFRSNVHRGGRTEAVQLSDVYERTAIRAAQVVGLNVAGVDMLEGAEGPEIMEVNSSPGLEGIEGATGVDVAGEMVRFVEEKVEFPGFDLRQRLTVSRGYGVSELVIGEDSPLVGKTLGDSGLRALDIIALTIEREGGVIANPRHTRTLESGDRLLCFGKLEAMKGYLAPKQTRRRRAAMQRAGDEPRPR